MTIHRYVVEHTGFCSLEGAPTEWGIAQVYMYGGIVSIVGHPMREQFVQLTKDRFFRQGHDLFIPLDRREHSYTELAKWLDATNQLALRYMALGVHLGVFRLLSPTLVGVPRQSETAMRLFDAGMLSVIYSDVVPRNFV